MKSSESAFGDALSTPAPEQYTEDLVIVGGGIAGLWLLNVLRNSGYRVLLLDREPLGNAQTLSSQGIIHGGLKYALSGSISTASNAIVEMPSRWRECLEGRGSLDLKGCELLSEHYYMWSANSFRSKIKTFLGSKSLRGRVEPVGTDELPAFFARIPQGGQLYRLPDFVINTPSLLSTLASNNSESLRSIAGYHCSFPEADPRSPAKVLRLEKDRRVIEISCQKILFCAGLGNAELISKAGLAGVKMQSRPLKMVYLKHPDLQPLFCHCIGSDFRMNPALTITSHRDESDRVTWYLGGDLAELGVGRTDSQQIAAAESALHEYFPHLDLSAASWSCVDICRAENEADGNHRPDNPFIYHEDDCVVVWPTKLTLAPALGDNVSHLLKELNLAPTEGKNTGPQLRELLDPLTLASQRWDSP